MTLDYGFRGTPGTPLLIEEMLGKSKASDLVLVDLTFTSSKNWFYSKQNSNLASKNLRIKEVKRDKFSSNPNVLLETGYAWAHKGFHRTLAIMNIAFGSPQDLSVDMDGFRWGITFNLDSKNYADRKSIRKVLADDLYNAFRTSLNSVSTYQRDKWKPFRINSLWNDSDFQSKYFLVPELKEFISKMRIDFEHNSIVHRLIGPPKSGKTRLAREVLNELNGFVEKHELVESILYYDMGLTDFSSIEIQVQDLRDLNQKKIVIIDNCPLNTHQRLVKEFTDTDVRLLTISEGEIESDHDSATICITEEIRQSIIDAIVEKSVNPEDRSNAIAFINNDLGNTFYFQKSAISSKAVPDEKWKDILNEHHEYGFEILKVLSIFTHVAKRNRDDSHLKLVQSFSKTDEKTIDEFLTFSIEKGIVATKGDFYQVILFRDELSITWWRNQDPQTIDKSMLEVSQHGLSKQLGSRLIELVSHNLIEGQDSIKSGFSEIFAYDFLNTEEGSHLFKSLVEISPTPLVDKVQLELAPKTTEELTYFVKGRRNIVWALEKLCFREETFEIAARILFQLALAENEIISNNATGQFLGIFQPVLGGTQANLERRIELLKNLQKDFGLSELIINAYSRMLTASQYHRMSGPEVQLGETLDDHKPEWKDRLKYWAEGINSLLAMEGDFKSRAEEVFIKKFHQQYIHGNSGRALEAMKALIARNNGIPQEVLQVFTHIKMSRNVSPEQKDVLEEIIKGHQPKDISELIQIKVIDAPYEAKKIEENWIDTAAQNAKELAIKLIADGDDSWQNELHALQSGEQRQSFAFGEGIGESVKEPKKILELAIDTLRTIELSVQNEMFINGLISGVGNEEFTRMAIAALAQIPEVCHHAIRLNRFIKILNDDVAKIQSIINDHPEFVNTIQYLKFDHLSSKGFIDLISWLSQSNEFGVWLSLDFLEDRISKQKELGEYKEVVLAIIPGLLSSKMSGPMGMFKLEQVIRQLLDDGPDKEEVKVLVSEIILACEDSIGMYESHMGRILEKLFEYYWDLTWPKIGGVLIDPSHESWWGVMELLKKHNNYPADKLLQWIEARGVGVVPFLMMVLSFESTSEDSIKGWNPIVLTLLEKYGKDERVLNELSARIHSFSTSGSAIPIFEHRKSMLIHLRDNSKGKVKAFAEQEIERFNLDIEREMRWQQNMNLGEI